MEFLDNLVLSQSKEHIFLLHTLMVAALFLFVPFLSIILGGTFLSAYFRRRSERKNDKISWQMAKDVIDFSTISKGAGFMLGVVPVLGIILILAQLLHTIEIASLNYLVAGLHLLVAGLIFAYTYKYSLSFGKIIEFAAAENSNVEDPYAKKDVEKYHSTLFSVNRKSGFWGVFFLLVGSYFYTSAIELIMLPDTWNLANGFLATLTSTEFIMKWLMFITSAFAISSSYLMFRFFYWEGGKKEMSEEYATLARTKLLKFMFPFALLQPVLLLVNLFLLPANVLSNGVFGFVLLAVLTVFLSYQFIYDMLKNNYGMQSGKLFFTLLAFSFSVVLADQAVISNATKTNAAKLSAKYEEELLALKGSEAVASGISGEEVFTVRCAACHKFDVKIVGPAYKEVLPKYEGKLDALVSYVLNPVPVNSAFPPMPNPGLKPNEAEAVAKYILEEYKK